MGLCEICQKIDFPHILQLVAGGHYHWYDDTSNLPSDCKYCHVKDNGIPHFPTYAALKAASDHGCDLCRLIRISLKEDAGLDCSNWVEVSPEEIEYLSSPVIFYPYCLALEGELPRIQVIVGSGYSSDFACNLEVSAPRDNFPRDGRGLLFTSVHADSAESSCLTRASEWLQTCLKDHPSCAKITGRGRQLASRFIDVGSSDGLSDPCLHLGHKDVSSWVALSYCWGGQSDFVLNDQTMSTFISGIPLSKFPATLRDAVVITRRLGVRYLWVDALCIQQDSEEDWRRESARMRDVYNGAVVTLVAADAPSVHAGIFSKRAVKFDTCLVPWNINMPGGSDAVTPKEVYVRSASCLEQIAPLPLQQRGWALQEDLLSCRTLTYSNSQMIWQCWAYKTDEGGRFIRIIRPTGKWVLQKMLKKRRNRMPSWIPAALMPRVPASISPSTRGVEPRVQSRVYNNWALVVWEYTTRELTRKTDMLPGLAGLASEFARYTRDAYCAGLWQRDLLFGLMWFLDPTEAVKSETAPVSPAVYRAPSWSWAAINGFGFRVGPTSQVSVRMEKWREKAKVVRVQVEPLAPDNPFGQIKAGQITLQGLLYFIGNILEADPPTIASIQPSATVKALRALLEAEPRMKQELQQQHRFCTHQRFALFKLIAWVPAKRVTKAEYLLLESTTNNSTEVFRRIGYLSLSNNYGESTPLDNEYPRETELGLHDVRIRALMEDAFRELEKDKVRDRLVKIV